jgi:hypothetical protein
MGYSFRPKLNPKSESQIPNRRNPNIKTNLNPDKIFRFISLVERHAERVVQAGHHLRFKPGTWFTLFCVSVMPAFDWHYGFQSFIENPE